MKSNHDLLAEKPQVIAAPCTTLASASLTTVNYTVAAPRITQKQLAKDILNDVAEVFYPLAALNNNAARVGPKFEEAAKLYRDRRDRRRHPAGKKDNGGRWYPSESEDLDTDKFRTPSRSWPWSYMHACRSFRHCCDLHKLSKTERKKARLLAKLLDYPLIDAVDHLNKNGLTPPPEIVVMIP